MTKSLGAISSALDWCEDVLLEDYHLQKNLIETGLELNDQYQKIYTEEASKKPFNLNIIDELHANENAHTRILIKLLKYTQADRYVILESFLELINNFNLKINKPYIDDNKEFIDGIIEEKGKYGIIIENKIHDAVDQDKQIECYVDRVHQHGVPQNRIWVIYLTRDGSKIIEDYSLTERTAKILQDRYIPLNYKYHILPWLKTKVQDLIPSSDIILKAGLIQYIDHLEGMFNQREIDKRMNKKLEQLLTEKLELGNLSLLEKYQALDDKCDEIQALLDNLTEMRDTITNEHIWPTVMDEIDSIAERIALKYDLRYTIDNGFRVENKAGYVCFKKKGWSLGIYFQRKDDYGFFEYIGIPWESEVDESFRNSGNFCFREHSQQKGNPYGWQWILDEDLLKKGFAEYMESEVARVLKEIDSKGIKMR